MLDISKSPGGNRLHGTKKKAHQLKIDMTPMVDLGFLLISFFVITTQLGQPKAMDLIVPKKGTPNELGMSKALTFILTSDKIVSYSGDWENAYSEGKITALRSLREVRSLIQSRQQILDGLSGDKEKRDGLMLLIKPSKDANFNVLVNMLDEVIINDVKKYALVDVSEAELEWLKHH